MTRQEYIERLVAEAPPLTPAQLDRLTVVFRPAKDSAVAA